MASVYLKIILSSFVVLLAQHAVKITWHLGFHKMIYNHEPGPCHPLYVPGNGTEAMVLLENGLAFIATYRNPPLEGGTVYLYDFNQPEAGAVELSIEKELKKHTLRPVAIGAWRNNLTGEITVFVGCRQRHGDYVEKFNFENSTNTLRHVHTIVDQHMRNIRSLAATSDTTFYFVTWLSALDSALRKLEVLLMLPLGGVVFYDGHEGKVVEHGLFLPSAVALSKDQRYMYVSVYGTEEIRTYHRKTDLSLQSIETAYLYSAANSIQVTDEDGSLVVTAHRQVFQHYQYLTTPTLRSPSQVLKVQVNHHGNITSIKEIFSNDGSLISGANAAIYYRGNLLLATARHHMLQCDVRTF